jgi:hypothetical protein
MPRPARSVHNKSGKKTKRKVNFMAKRRVDKTDSLNRASPLRFWRWRSIVHPMNERISIKPDFRNAVALHTQITVNKKDCQEKMAQVINITR